VSFIDNVLEPPSYGWTDPAGNFLKPGAKKIFREFFSRLNIFKDKKNWLSFTNWLVVAVLGFFLFVFLFRYFSITLMLVGFVYGMIIMGSHGTIWYHRYGTHRAFEFRNHFTQGKTYESCAQDLIRIVNNYKAFCALCCKNKKTVFSYPPTGAHF
jgi:hypothetical protein